DSKPAVGKAAATASKFIKSYAKGGRGSAGANLDAAGVEEGEEGSAAEVGQLVELMFMAPAKVAAMTRAAQEGRDARLAAKQQQPESDDDRGSDRGSQRGARSGSDDDGDDESEYDYDSDETGELESGSDEEYEEDSGKGTRKGSQG
ncbi:hypothetical protein HaLaN_28772, partial [Haematococcus lacustris]